MIKNDYIKIFEKEFKINNILKKQLLSNKKDIKINMFQNWDSMKHVKILTNIEKKFKINIDIKNEKFFQSFQSGIKYLKKIIT
tara:strand:+ start:267 stop:515 length:249 start_codon:yes stop_codon:yes gene_type:complete